MKKIVTYLDYVKENYGICDEYDLEQAIFWGELPNGDKIKDIDRNEILSRLCCVVFSARDVAERLKATVDEL